MVFVLTLLVYIVTTPFESTIDRAFTSLQNYDWAASASALDEAYAVDAQIFDANNFHYLRGRIAERQNDWMRARTEFSKVGVGNPLRDLAVWHAARASAKLQDHAAAADFLAQVSRNFPAELKTRLAREAGSELALRIYQDLNTREARFQRAKATGDRDALWALVREMQDDEPALYASHVLAASATSPRERMTVAEVFVTHRQFDDALPLYQQASLDVSVAPDARYQVARIHFQQEKYRLAIDEYQLLAKDFEGTDWEKDAQYQIASCYWRLADYRNSEKAYLEYIRKYGHSGMEEAATRNLVDVYRALGENQKAVATLDRSLATRLSASTRQVFLFTKAKILYSQKKYAAALAVFQQLGRTRLRSAPGSATAEEVQYFQALCQFALGNKTAADVIWRKLARDEFSYYGQRSAEKLGQTSDKTSSTACSSDRNSIVKSMELDLENLRHPIRKEVDAAADPVSELVFLRLWDEAAFWLDRLETRTPRQSAAEISYLGGQYHRAISLANRLPKTASTLPLVYPAGYHRLICDAAANFKIDPLWLHAIIWQESKYDPTSRSGAAARGLMQFIPETANSVGGAVGMSSLGPDELYDPAISIQLGAAYWSQLMQKLKSPELALAAYNGGPGNVERWLSKSTDRELFVSDIGFVETKKYVMSVFAARAAYGSLVN
jgi:soluble lytic murein transglycosylase-like protein